MRKRVPKPKTLEEIAIPDDLRTFLCEVNTAIVEDVEEATIESDDLLQSPTAYAGLIEEGGVEFGVTYFPNHATRSTRDKWEMILTKDEIEQIALGTTTSLQLWSCTSPDCHSRFTAQEYDCFYCDYEDDPETISLRKRLNELAQKVNSKEEWVAAYLKLRPDATSSSLIGDFNPIDGLGERIGWFSSVEAQKLIDRFRSEIENGT